MFHFKKEEEELSMLNHLCGQSFYVGRNNFVIHFFIGKVVLRPLLTNLSGKDSVGLANLAILQFLFYILKFKFHLSRENHIKICGCDIVHWILLTFNIKLAVVPYFC